MTAERLRAMLVTGMSGVGKSTVLAALRQRGIDTVDTDEGNWIEDVDGEPLWSIPRMTALLDRPRDRPLAVQGTVANQGQLYHRFDAVVLLTAPQAVILERLRTRTSNDYGKSPAERSKVEQEIRDVEPLLRIGATHVIDASAPLVEVVEAVERIIRGRDIAPAE
ncbi:AAA family ATPase [Salinibacterium sp. NK8237]|uniref:AAA family ATPase n=1 Tax=Salinibacterium sp. NK8237 TaxID=2792038 RepID=UPI0018CE62D7|nr:AAA family ATPase [Salinibacterium sp. NK8237]MBH0131318.1 AAA family ATPase [Salinibacterium sp. NK8237]